MGSKQWHGDLTIRLDEGDPPACDFRARGIRSNVLLLECLSCFPQLRLPSLFEKSGELVSREESTEVDRHVGRVSVGEAAFPGTTKVLGDA